MTEPRYTKEAHDLLVALAKWHGGDDYSRPNPACVERARALMAALEAEKASAETQCEVHGPNPGYATHADDCTCPKAKPQERSAEERIEAARDMVSALCKPRGTRGSREWIMSIPAQRNYDPDLVIMDGLDAVDELRAERDEFQRRIEAAKAEISVNTEYPNNEWCSSNGRLMRILSGGKP